MLPYIAYMDPMGTEIIPNKWIRMGKNDYELVRKNG